VGVRVTRSNNMQVNVPVRLMYPNLRVPICYWVTEPKEVTAGVFVASTFLSNIDRFAAVRFLNISGFDYCKSEHASG